MDHTAFIHVSLEKHLDYFQFGAITNKTATTFGL